jgi:L-aspartate oxidase
MKIIHDLLVIGSGIAGLSFALKAAKNKNRDVAIITKRAKEESSTLYAQGGIASVFSSQDSFEAHIRDTLFVGGGLCKREVVELCVQEGPERIRELEEYGVNFTKREESLELDLAKEGGHSVRRIVHAGDLTGVEIEKTLLQRASECKNITFYEDHMAIDLISLKRYGGEDRCIGIYVLDVKKGQVKTFLASCIFLATGGVGKVYLVTSNPDVATGDGIAMAYRIGAKIANMEFIQFHPTCLYHPHAKAFLLSEAMRGEGGILRLINGERFMERYHPQKELAPRDIVSRAIDTELKRRGDDHVLLDMTHLDPNYIITRFPNIHKRCLQFGIDMRKDPIPVIPAAHYLCGGIVTDIYGRTSKQGLFAGGETACTGLHGANRLASNSLLEALVFAHRSAQIIEREIKPLKDIEIKKVPKWDIGKATPSDEMVVVSQNWDEIRRLMWNYVGIVRSNKRLKRAKRRIELLKEEIKEYYWDFLVTRDLLELRNIATVGELIITCAEKRKESRGLHFNLDYPSLDPNFCKDTILSREGKS